MPIPFAADLDCILTHAGLPVVCGGSSTVGILRKMDTLEQIASGDPMQRRATTLLVRTGTIADADLAVDADITVNGVAYKVRWFDESADGSLTKLQIAPTR